MSWARKIGHQKYSNAPKQNVGIQEVGAMVGSVAGMIGGAKVGTVIGTIIAGPVGGAVGAFIGHTTGNITGAINGYNAPLDTIFGATVDFIVENRKDN